MPAMATLLCALVVALLAGEMSVPVRAQLTNSSIGEWLRAVAVSYAY